MIDFHFLDYFFWRKKK